MVVMFVLASSGHGIPLTMHITGLSRPRSVPEGARISTDWSQASLPPLPHDHLKELNLHRIILGQARIRKYVPHGGSLGKVLCWILAA